MTVMQIILFHKNANYLHAMQLIIILWICMYVYETLLGVIWAGALKSPSTIVLYISHRKEFSESQSDGQEVTVEQNACEACHGQVGNAIP